ncbi:molybdate ABC transporter substrate-binding protein [Pollutimonas harenae]|uniref:Molybdate ABC transporter substrate-binding protein n=1 Tax=Pollutimonas harenae TaxID=657015 RepID=A0A853GT60_9BURK|nr:molybdate ABC transporter substrate-binding protein [Pollutimonas harenae]NYT86328.1 molybdate ABC transporter substrate-binding protein [Pollutimonas harenae]TEA69914.1 molybdate ABC transporter substrate-binding protein [Pollutimonas harenae]
MKFKKWIAAAACAATSWHAQASAADMLVGAAASLTNAFTELATQFQQKHPATKVLMSFASSDVLAKQVIEGAPMDIYASADQTAMDQAVDAGSIETDTRHDFARNELVLIVPADDPNNIRSLADLRSAGVKRIALGNPASVPVGRYTKGLLEQAGDWTTIKKNEVLGQNVRQVLAYVARGEVDAGFVYATDAAIMPGKVNVVATLPSTTPLLYPIALVKRDGRHPEAKAFLDFIDSDEGQAVLSKYGFSKP